MNKPANVNVVLPLAAFLIAIAIAGTWSWKSHRNQGDQSRASDEKGGGALTTPTAMPNSTAIAPAAKIMYHCAMHPNYISDKPGNCPICGMKLVPMGKSPDRPGDDGSHGVRIDPTTVQNMGVRTEEVARRDLQTEVRSNGTVTVDESRLFIVNARVMGYAEKLDVNFTGQRVLKGQALLEIYSPDLVSAQEEYLQALRYAQATQGKAPETGSRDLVESSRRRLLNWGVTAGEIGALEKLGHARNTMSIASPAGGVVLEKKVVAGQNITPGMELYRIADLSRVWIVANVYQRDLDVVRPGASAEVELSYLHGKPFRGKVTFISPVLDEQTKTAEVRIEIPNTSTLDFKPGMFATVRILSPSLRNVLAVPEQAIIRSGRRTIAVIARGDGYFEPREVKLGAAAGDYVEILDGIGAGEKIVVSSQFLIDSESNLKAAIQQMQSVPGNDTTADSVSGGAASPNGMR